MNVTSMSDAQRQALLDLFILGMYCDRHLALSEDQRINRLLDQFRFESEYDRQRTLDATISRLSPLVANETSLKASIEESASKFDSAELRRAVYTALVQLLE